jgi:predicted Zn-dependent protease
VRKLQLGRSCALTLFLLQASLPGQDAALLDILNEELVRNFTALKKTDPAPYYIGYAVTEQEAYVLSVGAGTLLVSDKSTVRYFDVSVRVGTPQLDNYHRMRGERPRFTAGIPLPVEDDRAAIQRRVWAETDRAYRLGAQRLINIKTNTQVKVEEQDKSDDFSSEQPSKRIEPVAKVRFVADEWAPRLRKVSAEFAKYPAILSSNITVVAQRQTKSLVDSEGSRLQHGRVFARIMITARGKAADGMDLGTSESFEASDPAKLPKDDVLLNAVKKVAGDLTALAKAPEVDPFAGPAILSGRAAGVFFHEIFGHRVEGHRQKDETEGQTFTKSVNSKVLPEFLSVIFDPTIDTAAGKDLNGSYLFDDEGVQARPVTLVENGILKTFLMSRSPIEGFPHSNGHGRRQPGAEVVSRQSNLIVKSSNEMPEAKLREMLIAEIKRQNKPYGLYFKEVTGGYTLTGRRGLQAFTVMPVVVYQVFPDGKPDQLVRGVDIVGTPLASFARIVATSDAPEVFNGICGAESGSVPVSAVSPALLVSELEIQRRQKSDERPPLLPRPRETGAAE